MKNDETITIYKPTAPQDVKKAADLLASINVPPEKQVWADLELSGKELADLRPNLEESRRTFKEQGPINWATIIYCDTRKVLMVNYDETKGRYIGVEIKEGNK